MSGWHAAKSRRRYKPVSSRLYLLVRRRFINCGGFGGGSRNRTMKHRFMTSPICPQSVLSHAVTSGCLQAPLSQHPYCLFSKSCRLQMIANSAIGKTCLQQGIRARRSVRHSEHAICVDERRVRSYSYLPVRRHR